MPDERLARALRARIRRKILTELIRREMLSVSEVAKILNIPKYTASKHLKLLHDLGILECVEDPPRKLYRIAIPEIKNLLREYEIVAKKLAERLNLPYKG